MQTIFKSTEGLIPMDYAAIYREKHIKGMLDARIMGDKPAPEEEEESEPDEPTEPPKPEPDEEGEGEVEPPAPVDSIEITNLTSTQMINNTIVATYITGNNQPADFDLAPTGYITGQRSTKPDGTRIITLTRGSKPVTKNTIVKLTLTSGTATDAVNITVKPEPIVYSLEVESVSKESVTKEPVVITYVTNDTELATVEMNKQLFTITKHIKEAGKCKLTLTPKVVEADALVTITLIRGSASDTAAVTIKEIINTITINSVSARETTGADVIIKYATVSGEKAGVWSAPEGVVSTTNAPVNGVQTIVVKPIKAVTVDTPVTIHFSTDNHSHEEMLTVKPAPPPPPTGGDGDGDAQVPQDSRPFCDTDYEERSMYTSVK